MPDQPTSPSPPIAKQTTVGNYFVSNYPPFSFWKPEFVPDALAALERPASFNPPSAIPNPSDPLPRERERVAIR